MRALIDCPKCGGRLVDLADAAANLVGVDEQVTACQSCGWECVTLAEPTGDDDGDLVESGGTW